MLTPKGVDMVISDSKSRWCLTRIIHTIFDKFRSNAVRKRACAFVSSD